MELDITKLEFEKHLKYSDFKITQVSWGFLNETLIAASIDGYLAIIDYKTEEIIKKSNVHEGEIKQFVFSKDFSLLATAANDGCKVFDPENLDQLRYFKYEVPMNAVAISPLLNIDKHPRHHLIVAGGIPARETARTKF